MVLIDTTPGQSVMAIAVIGASGAREADFLQAEVQRQLAVAPQCQRVVIDAQTATDLPVGALDEVASIVGEYHALPMILTASAVEDVAVMASA